MLTQAAAAFIAKAEGFRAAPYQDGAGVWTIGCGTTVYPNGKRVTAVCPAITEATAEEYLEDYIVRRILPRLRTLHNWNRLNENQQVACISLAYNIGEDKFVSQSSVARAIEGNNFARIPADIMLWDKMTVGGKLVTSKGLQNRRQAEVDRFNTPVTTSSAGV